MVPATIVELSIAVPSPACSHAAWRFLNRLPPNHSGGGVCASRSLLREAAMAVQNSLFAKKLEQELLG